MPQCPAKRIQNGEIAYCQLEQGHAGNHELGRLYVTEVPEVSSYRQRAVKRLRDIADQIERGEI